MLVRFLKAAPYTPTPTDSPRCYGQLRLRPTTITEDVTVEVTRPDGSTDTITTTQTTCGPMERYFPVGAKPELSDDVAAGFIAAGIAEAVSDDVAQLVSTTVILEDVKVD